MRILGAGWGAAESATAVSVVDFAAPAWGFPAGWGYRMVDPVYSWWRRGMFLDGKAVRINGGTYTTDADWGMGEGPKGAAGEFVWFTGVSLQPAGTDVVFVRCLFDWVGGMPMEASPQLAIIKGKGDNSGNNRYGSVWTEAGDLKVSSMFGGPQVGTYVGLGGAGHHRVWFESRIVRSGGYWDSHVRAWEDGQVPAPEYVAVGSWQSSDDVLVGFSPGIRRIRHNIYDGPAVSCLALEVEAPMLVQGWASGLLKTTRG